MFYIHLNHQGGNSKNFPPDKRLSIFIWAEVDPAQKDNSALANAKATAAIRNIQQVYYLENRWFS